MGALAAIAWAFRPLWSALATFISKKSTGGVHQGESRISELEAFKIETEGNHFHDLEELKADRRDVWDAISLIRKDYNDFRVSISERISRLEARIFNGHNK